MKTRVYGDKIEIDQEKVAQFYNERAKTISKRKQAYTTVLLGDQNPDYANEWDKFEKNLIIPKMDITSKKNVLDIGCGMGRWADSLCGKCNIYCGVDLSEDMIAVARKNHPFDNTFFYNMSMKDALVSNEVTKNKYDIVIITGVMMYINDSDLKECIAKLYDVLNQNGKIYIEESVGKKDRLTLNQTWSDSLDSYYDAIYRTRDEYIELLHDVIESCFVEEEGFMDALDKEDMSETSHWYMMLRKE